MILLGFCRYRYHTLLFRRPEYTRLIKRLRRDDVIAVMSIDRLGRNYEEILEQWRLITKVKQANIVILDMPLLDTRQKEKDLTGTLIADLVLQILSYAAQAERECTKKRQAEGIAAAKKRGVRFGAPYKQKPEGFEQYRLLWEAGAVSARAAARCMNIAPQTFKRLCDNAETSK